MKKIVNSSEMVEIISNSIKGTSMVSVDLDSPMDGKGKMLKTDNPFWGLGIVKRETLTGVIGYDYGKAVNRVASKEGKEERDSKMHPWGDMDENNLFRIHRKTQNKYLSMKVESVTVHGYLTAEGEVVDTEAIKKFIPEKSKSSTQADLDKEVIARDYGMDNIRAIRMKGDEYIILQSSEVEAIKETVRTNVVVTV